ncbi:uncharacterized protein MONBRDRAFT_23589 [Monosiga brevicollis MX1]|uniref:Uncharacterized protein n=1 Tax=Monosiga brevicollis TaxID=81824 RepID=A9UTW2_MONBE|nr:uncharacterized protein MONBRDRAFT_23589 [Monosiga brevicollis MX1]EDQ91563.1 predicted protein [Monosiga brevicollis MX1]|eukprot:XP_001743985.1 hypothetical protein [Monosiga brevicollis MX1]
MRPNEHKQQRAKQYQKTHADAAATHQARKKDRHSGGKDVPPTVSATNLEPGVGTKRRPAPQNKPRDLPPAPAFGDHGVETGGTLTVAQLRERGERQALADRYNAFHLRYHDIDPALDVLRDLRLDAATRLGLNANLLAHPDWTSVLREFTFTLDETQMLLTSATTQAQHLSGASTYDPQPIQMSAPPVTKPAPEAARVEAASPVSSQQSPNSASQAQRAQVEPASDLADVDDQLNALLAPATSDAPSILTLSAPDPRHTPASGRTNVHQTSNPHHHSDDDQLLDELLGTESTQQSTSRQSGVSNSNPATSTPPAVRQAPPAVEEDDLAFLDSLM